METQCKQCQEMPFTHSFFIKEEDDTQVWFYSGEHHVSHVDRTVANVIAHIRGELAYFHQRAPLKKWNWILDGQEFEFRWDSIELVVEMVYVVKEYKSSFNGLYIKKANPFLQKTVEYCKPFVATEYLELLYFEE